MQTPILLLLCALCVACHASTMYTFSVYPDSDGNFGMLPARVNLATGKVTRFKSGVEYWGAFQPQAPIAALDQKGGLLYFTPNQAIPYRGIVPAIYTYDIIHDELLPPIILSAPIHGINSLNFDNVNGKLYTVFCEDGGGMITCVLYRVNQDAFERVVYDIDSTIFMQSSQLASTIDGNSSTLYFLYTPNNGNNETSYITSVDLVSGKVSKPIAIKTNYNNSLYMPAWFDQSTGRILVIGTIMIGKQPYLSLFKVDPKTGSYTAAPMIPSNYPTVFSFDPSTNLLWIIQQQFSIGAPETLQSYNIRTGKLGQPQVLNGDGTTLAAEIDPRR